jgi:hypothetical protein
MNSIYALLDPNDNEPRYIGKSKEPETRFKAHCCGSSNTHSSRWIQSLKRTGLKPKMVIIEDGLSEDQWPEREQFWIAYYREAGANLTNITDGGHHIVKERQNPNENEWYTMPDFDRVIDVLIKTKAAKALTGEARSYFLEILRTASKNDNGLTCYKKSAMVNYLERAGLLSKLKKDGVHCHHVVGSDMYSDCMRTSTGIPRQLQVATRGSLTK